MTLAISTATADVGKIDTKFWEDLIGQFRSLGYYRVLGDILEGTSFEELEHIVLGKVPVSQDTIDVKEKEFGKRLSVTGVELAAYLVDLESRLKICTPSERAQTVFVTLGHVYEHIVVLSLIDAFSGNPVSSKADLLGKMAGLWRPGKPVDDIGLSGFFTGAIAARSHQKLMGFDKE